MKALLSMISSPSGLILFASILGAIGALWSSQQKAEFERELRKKAEEIAALNKKTYDAVIGGDSFCYLSMAAGDTADSKCSRVVVHEGENPLYDVSLRIVDLDKFAILKEQGKLSQSLYSDEIVQLGTLPPQQAATVGEADMSKFPARGFNVFFSARNGMFIQSLRMKFVDGKWRRANRVQRVGGGVLLEKIDPEYPRGKNGGVEW